MNSTPTPPGGLKRDPTSLPEPGGRLGKYTVVREIGQGGMGVVFEATDPLGRSVALKVLRFVGTRDVNRFKREFRSLEDLSHRNLVNLYELVASPQGWCFAMELVEGSDVLTYLHRAGKNIADGSGQWQAISDSSPDRASNTPYFRRLRSVLGQLVDGVSTLHDAGKLHRDIKPSNVLVSHSDDRVVLVDFGLAADIENSPNLSGEFIVGTAPYVAPELLGSTAPGPEADWYSVGVLLYEALTHRMPFEGTFVEIMMEKEEREPTPADIVAPWAPADLCLLCTDLLRRDPKARPNSAEIRRRLGMRPRRARSRADSSREVELVGRNEPVDQLRHAVLRSRKESEMVAIRGASGIGKSAVLDELVERVADDSDVLVLRGRCHPQERIPFKALDGVVERLARYLGKLPAEDRRELAPESASALVTVFPALNEVFRTPQRPDHGSVDPRERRRVAFECFGELMRLLCAKRGVVMVVDDLHHGDVDSAELLRQTVQACPRNLTIVVSFNDDDVEANPCLGVFLRSDPTPSSPARTEVELGPMAAEDVRALVESALAGNAHAESAAKLIAVESGGNPRLALELAHQARAGASLDYIGQLTFSELLIGRIEQLHLEELNLLELIAVAGRPLSERILSDAARLGGTTAHPVHRLASERLVKSLGGAGHMRVDAYHAQVRAIVLERLTEPRRASLHRELALALERAGAPPEQLVHHWREAGELERAGEAAERAGTQAFESLAFDLAVNHYQYALRIDRRKPRQLLLLTRLADALSYAGRAREAADIYLEAAGYAQDTERLELFRRAASAFLITGHVQQAFAALGDVMDSVSLTMPRSPRRAVASLLWRRGLLRLRGLRARPARQLEDDESLAVDLCRALATGLGNIDPVMGGYFQVRHTELALKSGDPARVAVALASEAVYLAAGGRKNDAKAEKLISRAEAFADQQDAVQPKAFTKLARGMMASLTGRWQDSIALCGAAANLLEGCPENVGWELAMARLYQAWGLLPSGDFKGLRTVMETTVRDAKARSDLFTATSCRTGYINLMWLARGEVDQARSHAVEAIEEWQGSAFHVQHYFDLLAQTHIDLAEGDGARALQRVLAVWPLLKESNLMFVQTIRLTSWDLRGRAALAAAACEDGDPHGALAEAKRCARRMHRIGSPSALAMGASLEASIDSFEGNRAHAVGHLRVAMEVFDSEGMTLYGDLARLRLGALLNDSEGARMVADVSKRLARSGVSHPHLLVRALMAPTQPRKQEH